jgi:hypothetical protein
MSSRKIMTKFGCAARDELNAAHERTRVRRKHFMMRA